MFKGRAFTLKRLTTLMVTTAALVSCGGDDISTETTITEIDTRTPSQDWQLVWSDEFDNSSLDMGKWSFEINCDGGGNSEEQCYTDSPENLFIEDGILNIVARPTEAGSGLTKPYTSSRIVTRGKGDFTYGRVEVRAKAPRGQGSWAAAWLMPTDSVYGTWPLSGEIDLVEWVNIGEVRADGDVDNHAHGTLHYGPMQGGTHSFTGTEYALPNASPADEFHVYAIEWEEGEIRWYIDDVLYAYQRDSKVTYRASDGAAAGLSETGWYTQIINEEDESEIVYEKAPYDQDFFIILNNAVGGNWAGRTHQAANYTVGDANGTIARGVDPAAYVDGNAYQVDYVRVYECAKDPVTGKGCATISSDYYADTFVTGAAPVPIPPVIPVPVGVDLYTEEKSAWDLVGAEYAELIDSGDEEYGEVIEFTVTDDTGEIGLSGAAYDATLLPDDALVEFDLRVVSQPTDTTAEWLFKVEYEMAEDSGEKSLGVDANDEEATELGAVVLTLAESLEGMSPETGVWQHYSFELGQLRALGLNSEKVRSVKVFPTVGKGSGAVFQVDNVTIGAAFEGAELLLFADEENPNWPMWDDQVSKGISDVPPVVVVDEDATYGNVAEFYIYENSVVGFTVRQDQGGSGYPFDASSLALTGAIEFDLKLIDPPANPNAPWYLKLESNGGTNLGGTAVDYRLPEPPVQGEWTRYSVSLNSLLQKGLDISAIDIALVFPQWGQGNGARFRIDNMIIHSTTVEDGGGSDVKGPDTTVYQELFTLYDDAVRSGWTLWDCCAFLPQVEVVDDEEHNYAVEFTIGAGPEGGTVVGFWGRSSGEKLDLSPITSNGVLRFDLKVMTMPEDENTAWLLKVESSNATGNTFAELNLTDSKQGVAPTLGEWQTYSFPLVDLAGAGLNLTEVDLFMIFPEWIKGLGSVYRIDNVFIGIPEGDENPYGEGTGGGTGGGDDQDDGGDTGGDDGGNQEIGVELIENSDFSSSNGWGGTDGMVESIANGIFSADVAVAGNPWDVSLKQNMALLANATYTLTFDARSDDSRSIIAGLGLDEAPWTNVAETVSLTPEWTTYTFTMTIAEWGINNSRVFFDMGAEAGQVQLDNVSVVLVEGGTGGDDNSGEDPVAGELLTNSAFDSSDGWGGTDGMVESIANGIFSADVAVAGNPWDVSLKQNLTLVADTDYVLTFDARSDDSRSIIAGLGLDQDPWTNVTETVNLTTEWATYTVNLTTTGFGGENNRVFFDMGAEAGQVQLDNVSLMVASGDDNSDDEGNGDVVVTVAPASIFEEAMLANWAGWDCCAGSTPSIVADDEAHGMVTEFMVNGDTVLGFNGRDNGGALDASGVSTFSFDMKVTSLPTQNDAPWLLKIESGDATSYVEVNLSTSAEGVVPSEGVWQTYTFAMADLAAAGVNFNAANIDIVMVFPAWGQGAGAVYRIDNVSFSGESSGDEGGNDEGGEDPAPEPEPSTELLGNSSFDSSEGWGGTDGMAESIVDGIFSANVAVAGNPWDVSLKQNLTLVADTDYVLTFDARSDDSRSIIAGLGLDQDPWTNVTETVNLTTEWTTYTLYLTTTGFGGENNRVFFDMGAEAGQVQLDNVSLM
ncbi:carbohydrate binding domain-containing protein, partial [Thalassotalea agarivorans]